MKILLLSDTHGRLEVTRKIIEKHEDIDKFIHLGDVGFPLQELEQFQIVKGNHDRNTKLPLELQCTIEERSVLCLHGNIFDEETIQEILDMKNIANEELLDLTMNLLYSKLATYARNKGCDTVFFGHTHLQCTMEKDGVILINPGAVSFSMDKSGYAVVSIEQKNIDVKMYTIEEFCKV